MSSSASSDSTVHVSLAERSYDIQIGSGNLASCGVWLSQVLEPSRCVVITDENVRSYAETVASSLNNSGSATDILTLAPGESTKSVASAGEVWEQLLAVGADRRSSVVAVGGGVIGDLAGFVAATFARGISFAQVPTTLLAQVDSSVGGKTGINLSAAKNMVGSFWQPRAVILDTQVLNTLPDRDYRSGLAEVVKYGVILDAEFFGFLEQHVDEINARDSATLQHVVGRCCQLKADVVAEDELELTGRRAVLNYGHTFAHAFEAITGYGELLHGEAVSIGMECAARLARSLGRIDDQFTQRQTKLLTALQLPIETPAADADQLVSLMKHDKKTEHGRLRFVLPTRLGHVELVDGIDVASVKAAL